MSALTPPADSATRTYGFTFTLTGVLVCTEDMADAIYGRAADSGVSSRDGSVTVHFDRDAQTLDQAIRSAAADLRSVGYEVDRVTIDDEELSALTSG